MKTVKKVFLIALCIFALCLTSCSSDMTNTYDETSDFSNVSESVQNREYAFLVIPSESSTDKITSVFASAKKFGLGNLYSIEVIKELETSTYKNPLSDEELKYSRSECTYADDTATEYGKYYSLYDVYVSDKEEFTVLRGTNLVCYYYTSDRDYETEVQLTDDEAKAIADEFLIKILGEEIVAGFSKVVPRKDTMGSWAYGVAYSKPINGYETDEILSIFIGKSGKVVAYNGYNLCKFEGKEGLFATENVEAAKTALTDKINSLNLSNLEIERTLITTNTDGELYLRIDISYDDEYGMRCAESVFVSII